MLGDPRYYEIGGEKLVSVTTVLSVISKPALYKWYERQGSKKVFEVLAMLKTGAPIVHDWVCEHLPTEFLKGGSDLSKDAAKKGTDAHAWIERALKGEEFPADAVPVDARPSYERFLEFRKIQPFEIIKTEAVVHHGVFKYAGTMDALVRYPDGRVVLMDWKTSKSVKYPEYKLQVVAYKEAAEEMTGEKIDAMEIVRFGKEGEPFDPKNDWVRVDIKESDYLFNTFIHAMELFKWQSKAA